MANWVLDLAHGVFLLGIEEAARDRQQAILSFPLTAFQRPSEVRLPGSHEVPMVILFLICQDY